MATMLVTHTAGSERSEGSGRPSSQILRCAQDDMYYLQMSKFYQARLHCSHRILYHWLYDSCVAFRDKDKKPGDATTVEELIEMSESQGGERKK